MGEKYFIAIDPVIAKELKEFVFRKYGTTYGGIKAETEKAIRKHLAEVKQT